MKRKIQSMLTTLAVMAVVVSASAQPRADKQRQSPEERAKFMIEKMAEKLDLSEQQQQQILDLHKEMKAERGQKPERAKGEKGERPSKEDMEKKREEMKAKMEERRAEMHGKMQSILTPQQFETWKTEMASRPHHGRDHKMRDGKRSHQGHKNRDAKPCGEECKQ